MKVYFELQDEKGERRKRKSFEIDDAISKRQLSSKIAQRLNVKDEHQEIFFNDEQIWDFDLKEAGVTAQSTVIVKHDGLEHWSAFCAAHESARRNYEKHEHQAIKDDVREGWKQLKLLEKSDFFVTYPHLFSQSREFTKTFFHYLDADFECTEICVSEYFKIIFNDVDPELPEIKIKCRPKNENERGLQGGLICVVQNASDDLGKYYVKPHLGTDAHSPANDESADLRELFVYRLLESIGVGPEVHFIPNNHRSEVGLYIATKEVVGFRRASEVKMTNESMIQRALLLRVLYLVDLHHSNYGLDGEGNLSIVDFEVGKHAKSIDVADYLITCELGLTGDKDERIRVGKESFQRWKLNAALVDEMDLSLRKQKVLFKQNDVELKPSADLIAYLLQVKNNIYKFESVFGMT